MHRAPLQNLLSQAKKEDEAQKVGRKIKMIGTESKKE